jgi:CheY-like chemotaxis protein
MTLRSNLQREVERLGAAESRRLDLVALIHDIVASARHLADTRGVALDVAATDGPLHIVAQRVMLRQALLNLLSHAIRAHRGERIIISLDDADDNVRVSIRYDADASQLDNSQSPYAVAGQLLESLDIPWAETDAAEARTISLDIPLVRKQSVLLVDDNEGMAALFRRYLAHEPYRFLAVSDARAALEMVETLEPDVILLDVMMPEQDGWELLDLLRATGAGRQARVIVCSIIDDPELSAALGAEGFLHKPVDRASLLQALERATTTIHSRDEDG